MQEKQPDIFKISSAAFWSKDKVPCVNFKVEIPDYAISRATSLKYEDALVQARTHPMKEAFWSGALASLRPSAAEEEKADRSSAEDFRTIEGSDKIQGYLREYFATWNANVSAPSFSNHTISFHIDSTKVPDLLEHMKALFVEGQRNGLDVTDHIGGIEARKLPDGAYPNVPRSYTDLIIDINRFISERLDKNHPKRGSAASVRGV